MKTKVNSIVVPARFIHLCTAWHGGQDCMLYAICSTGNLMTGWRLAKRLSAGCDTDEQWYLHLWRRLADDVYHLVKGCDSHGADYRQLSEFEEWVDHIVKRLETEYGLVDWDG